ncbi:MAG TPA: hypothetical protein DGH68_00115 [Bacteroidetes bacterium]|nr:hypothetical protein [Bacteroidota bacterium]
MKDSQSILDPQASLQLEGDPRFPREGNVPGWNDLPVACETAHLSNAKKDGSCRCDCIYFCLQTSSENFHEATTALRLEQVMFNYHGLTFQHR